MARLTRKESSSARSGADPLVETEPTFLGTLRSEFDTEEELAPAWTMLASTAEAVRMAYLKHEITAQQTAEALSHLKLADRTGSEWTVGATSGEWYRRTARGSHWMRTPPPALALPAESDEAWLQHGVDALIERPVVEPSAAETAQEISDPKKEAESPLGGLGVLPADFLPSGPSGPDTFDDPDDFEAFLDYGTEATLSELEEPSGVDSGPVARANSVTSSDLFGWQPAQRSDGPELPEMPALEELDDLPPLEKSTPEFGYASLLSDFESSIGPEGMEPAEPGPSAEAKSEAVESYTPEPSAWTSPTADSQEETDDFFDLPDDLFYRPDGD